MTLLIPFGAGKILRSWMCLLRSVYIIIQVYFLYGRPWMVEQASSFKVRIESSISGTCWFGAAMWSRMGRIDSLIHSNWPSACTQLILKLRAKYILKTVYSWDSRCLYDCELRNWMVQNWSLHEIVCKKDIPHAKQTSTQMVMLRCHFWIWGGTEISGGVFMLPDLRHTALPLIDAMSFL